MKRFVSILMTLALLLVLPISASAAAISRPAVTTAGQQLTPADINSYTLSFLPATAEGAKRYLALTRVNDYKTQSIQDAAAAIGASATSDYDKMQGTYNYVLDHMTYREAKAKQGEFTASDILQRGSGQCYDYAVLTVALLNAQGIPAALALVQVDGQDGRNFYPSGNASIQETLLRDYNHAIVVAFSDGSWHIVDTTWGDSSESGARQKYFDPSIATISTRQVIREILPSGLDDSDTVKKTSVSYKLGTPKLTIDGKTATEFRDIVSGETRYFRVDDFAAVLSKYAPESKNFSPLAYPNITRGGFVPRVKYTPTGKEFKYELGIFVPDGVDPDTLSGTGYMGNYFFGPGTVQSSYRAIYYNGIAYADYAVMRSICAELNISLKISGSSITVDTVQP